MKAKSKARGRSNTIFQFFSHFCITLECFIIWFPYFQISRSVMSKRPLKLLEGQIFAATRSAFWALSTLKLKNMEIDAIRHPQGTQNCEILKFLVLPLFDHWFILPTFIGLLQFFGILDWYLRRPVVCQNFNPRQCINFLMSFRISDHTDS